jgi:hypothetical protein
MNDYIVLAIIVSIASVGIISIIADIIIGSEDDNTNSIIVKSSRPKTEQYQENEDDLIINE